MSVQSGRGGTAKAIHTHVPMGHLPSQLLWPILCRTEVINQSQNHSHGTPMDAVAWERQSAWHQ